MYSTTLRGVFPDPKPVYRRNFIKENVKSIKQMQGILQEAGVIQPRKRIRERLRNAARLSKSKESQDSNSRGNLYKNDVKKCESMSGKFTNKPMVPALRTVPGRVPKGQGRKTEGPIPREEEEVSKLTNRAMQTEREEDLAKLYESGIIKYPSPSVMKALKKPEKLSVVRGQGDQVDNISLAMGSLGVDEKNFIEENKNIKAKQPKQSPVKVLAQAPPGYQRGVVPKYLRDKKEDSSVEPDTQCPPGHVLLPEEERKETLRVLRQSYADRIQELNMMPVRNDTLKMRRRKMEIEEELKRIDGGIKVFQRPKVYVKINA